MPACEGTPIAVETPASRQILVDNRAKRERALTRRGVKPADRPTGADR
jgi:hypothetical protein